MPGFNKACQAARSEYQKAHKAYREALSARRKARSNRRNAEREEDRARTARDKAKAERVNAEKKWDDKTDAIQADPTFGVAGVTAGVIPKNSEGPTDASGNAGPYPLSNGSSFSLWVKGDDAAVSQWHTEASNKLAETITLAQKAGDTRAEEAAAENRYQGAADKLQQARQAYDAANAQVTAAETASKNAEQKVKTDCNGQTSTSRLDGGELVIHPGVLPEDEKRVKGRIDGIPDKEKDGLRKVEMKDENGGDMSYTDPNNGKRMDGQIAGTYSWASKGVTMYDGSGPGLEETIKHEIGHHVYSSKLSIDAQKKWREFWDKDNNKLKSPRGKMPTGYAGVSASEGFAEVYEAYYDNENLDPETKAKLEELLGTIQ